MRRLYKAALHLILLLSISLNVHGATHVDATETTPSQITYDVWGYIGDYCDVGTLKNLSVCSKCTHTYPQQRLRELKEWKDNGGLVTVTFGAATDEDKANYYRLKNAGLLRFENWDYQKVVNLFIDYIRINGADAEELNRISENARTAIDAHPSLTSSQKLLLKELLLPNISINDLHLNSSYMSGVCQCDAQHLTNPITQCKRCTCWCRLSNSDLRKLTPRFIARADEVTSSGNFISLYIAHNEQMSWRVFIKSMDYLNPELLRVLGQRLTEELNAGRHEGSDLMKLVGLFTVLREWEKSEQAFDEFVNTRKEFREWLFVKLGRQWHFKITKPLIQYATTISWVAGKAWGGVKRLLDR